ncbi:DUF6773 family protein [Candidatus Latescibacterota bacterium]
MIVDERIKTVRNRSAAGGFLITYCLLLIDLLYRQFYLKQSPGDYWDIFMIWFVSMLYVGITAFSSGMVSGQVKVGRQLKILIPGFIVIMFVIFYIHGKITTLHELAGIIVSLVVGVPVFCSVVLFYYYLNRRWEKKNELEE